MAVARRVMVMLELETHYPLAWLRRKQEWTGVFCAMGHSGLQVKQVQANVIQTAKSRRTRKRG